MFRCCFDLGPISQCCPTCLLPPPTACHVGVGFTLIDAGTKATAVNVAAQQDASYGPIVQIGPRFGDYAGIDIHPTTGRIWSANLWVWAPARSVDGQTVVSNAGARITVFR
jgi:hypothetical protein